MQLAGLDDCHLASLPSLGLSSFGFPSFGSLRRSLSDNEAKAEKLLKLKV
jgi:hypothetical protein